MQIDPDAFGRGLRNSYGFVDGIAKDVRQGQQQNALSAYAQNPNDPNALNALARNGDPRVAMQLRQQQQQGQAAKQERDAGVIAALARDAKDPPSSTRLWIKSLRWGYPEAAQFKGQFSPALRSALMASGGLKDEAAAQPTSMQRNHEYLNGIDPKLGSQYLSSQANPPRFIPDGQGVAASLILQLLVNPVRMAPPLRLAVALRLEWSKMATASRVAIRRDRKTGNQCKEVSRNPRLAPFAPVGIRGETVTSTRRTAARNKQVGGVTNSYHLSGKARDSVPPPGMSMAAYASLLRRQNPHLDVINEETTFILSRRVNSMPGIKQCTGCQKHKLPDFFSARSAKCKPCATEASREWRHSNPQRYAASVRAWRNRDDTAEKREGYRIKYRYGLTLAKRNEMLEDQAGACRVCHEQFVGAPNIDHCHTSGKVRGLLCDRCNRGLGYFKDNPAHLRSAAQYVEESQ